MQTKTEDRLTGFEDESIEDILADYQSLREYCNRWGYDDDDTELLNNMSRELAKRGIYSYK